MADSLSLSIRLDDPDTTHDLGDTVAGTLLLEAHDDVELQGLLLAPRYHVDSRGYDSAGGPDPLDLMPGGDALRAGETRELTFQVTLPFQPPPYDGRNFNVAWFVEAWADVAWARDPSAEPVPLRTRVGPASRDADYQRWVGAVEYDLEREEKALGFFQRLKEGSCVLKAAAGCFLPMAVFGAIAFFVGLLSVFFRQPLWELVQGGGGAMLPFLVLWWISGRLSASQSVGTLEIEAEPQVALPGDTIRCRVTYRPADPLSIAGATIALQARERFDIRTRSPVSDSSTTRRTNWDTLHTDVRDVAGATKASVDQPLEWEADFLLADDIPFSLEADSAGLRWSIRAEVAAPMRRDLMREKPIVIRP